MGRDTPYITSGLLFEKLLFENMVEVLRTSTEVEAKKEVLHVVFQRANGGELDSPPDQSLIVDVTNDSTH